MNKYSENALAIYKKLYLNKALNEKTPEDVHERVAKFISFNEEEYDQFKYMLDEQIFRPNTPAFINAGTYNTNPIDKQLMACFIYGLEDTMESIIDMWGTCSKIYASGAGVGINITNLREKDSPLSTSGKASGALAYLKILEIVSQTVMAGGKNRRAANLGVINIDHPDVFNLLNCKKDKQSFKSFNLSILATDSFMKDVCNNIDTKIKYNSPNPISDYNKYEQYFSAQKLWKNIIQNAWESGDPGMLFIDTANNFNPFPSYGPIKGANACVTGDTLILTNKGYKEIQSCINEKTIIWNGFEWSEVIPTITERNQKIYKIKFSNGEELKCTKYHKFKLINNIEKEAKDLIPEDKLIKWYFPVIHSGIYNKYAYTQGFFAGDGYYKRDNPNIWLYGEKKKVLSNLIYKKVNTNNTSRFNVYLNKEYIKDKRFVPNITWNVQSRLEFLAGLIDSDGCSLIDGGIQITSIDKQFIKEIKYLLNTLGIHLTFNLISKRGFKKLPKNDGTNNKKYYLCKNAWRITIPGSQVYKLLELGLKTYRVNTSLCLPNRDAQRFITIKEIEILKEKEEYVYCFNEPKNHTGIFNGIMTGQCQEIPLPEWSACVLGAINLNKIIKDNKIDWDYFSEIIKWSTIFLDNIIEKTSYLHPKFKEHMMNTRPIGLGIMGFADILIKLKITYGSIESINLFKHICKHLTIETIKTSIDLAKSRGPIPIPLSDRKHFKKLLSYYTDEDTEQIFIDLDTYGIRNCTWTTCQPTGSVALSADCSYSFEPLSAIVWQKELAETHEIMNFINPEFEKWLDNWITIGDFTAINLESRQQYKQDVIQSIINNNGSVQGIKEIPKEIQSIFVTAHDISPINKIDMQAAGQRYISLGISSTCNLPNNATIEDVEKIFKYAWEKKLKGITIYRDGSHEWQPINFGKKEIKQEVTQIEQETNKSITRPVRRSGETFEIKTPHGRLYCTFNKNKEGKPLEVFLRLGKSGTLENLLLDTISRLISKNLQNNVNYNDIVSLLRGIKEEKFWFRFTENNEQSLSAESIIDAVGIIMEEAFYTSSIKETSIEETETPIKQGYDLCPMCNRYTLKRDTGCRGGQCQNSECLFTNCG